MLLAFIAANVALVTKNEKKEKKSNNQFLRSFYHEIIEKFTHLYTNERTELLLSVTNRLEISIPLRPVDFFFQVSNFHCMIAVVGAKFATVTPSHPVLNCAQSVGCIWKGTNV